MSEWIVICTECAAEIHEQAATEAEAERQAQASHNQHVPECPVTNGCRVLTEPEDDQAAWEAVVRATLREAGEEIAEAAEAVGGFGQDYAEWAGDPVGFAREVLAEAAKYDA